MLSVRRRRGQPSTCGAIVVDVEWRNARFARDDNPPARGTQGWAHYKGSTAKLERAMVADQSWT
jgi:hypothetical protein